MLSHCAKNGYYGKLWCLVDASEWSASVPLVNPGSDVVVLPSFSCVRDLVPVSVISVARSAVVTPGVGRTLPEHMEDIVTDSHPSLGVEGRATLRDILHQYAHVFPAPGEPVTGRTTTVQHDIETNDTRPVRCGPRRLVPAGLRTEQTCIKEMLEGVRSSWLNSLTVKDAYPLPRCAC